MPSFIAVAQLLSQPMKFSPHPRVLLPLYFNFKTDNFHQLSMSFSLQMTGRYDMYATELPKVVSPDFKPNIIKETE